MPPRLPPPDPGTPAYVGLADQYTAAIADATAQAARLIHDGATLVGQHGPWAAALLFSVAPGARRRLVCGSIGDLVAPMPMYVIRPHLLVCRECLDHEITREIDRPPPCHRCGRPHPGHAPESHPVIAQRGHVIARGRLCSTCLYVEQSTDRVPHD